MLLALADCAHDDGTSAWPSQAWLAYHARCSQRTVRRHIQALEADGIIYRGNQSLVERFRADHRPVVWNLDMSQARGPVPMALNNVGDYVPVVGETDEELDEPGIDDEVDSPSSDDRTKCPSGHPVQSRRTTVSDKPSLPLTGVNRPSRLRGRVAPQDSPYTKKSSSTPRVADDETSDPDGESPAIGGTPGRKSRAERDRIAEERARSGTGLALRLKHGLGAAGVPGETNVGWLAKRLVAENKSGRSWDLLREMVDLFIGARERYTGQIDLEPFRVFLYRKAALAADAEKKIKARPKVFTPEDDAAWWAEADANRARRKKEADES